MAERYGASTLHVASGQAARHSLSPEKEGQGGNKKERRAFGTVAYQQLILLRTRVVLMLLAPTIALS